MSYTYGFTDNTNMQKVNFLNTFLLLLIPITITIIKIHNNFIFLPYFWLKVQPEHAYISV